jgi:hypothetical protein
MSGASGTTVAESHCLVVPVVLVDLEQLVLWCAGVHDEGFYMRRSLMLPS